MHEVILQFNDKKNAHKLLRNLSKGKGMVVRPEMLGGGFLSGITNIGKKIYHGAEDIRKNPAIQKVAEKTLDKAIDLGGKYAEKKLMAGGDGLWGSIGSIADHILGDGVKGRGRPRKSHKKKDEDGDGLWSSIGDVADHILGDGVKRGKKRLVLPRDLAMYRKTGGSMVPL